MFGNTTATPLTREGLQKALGSIKPEEKSKTISDRLVLPIQGQTTIQIKPTPSLYGNADVNYRMKVINKQLPAFAGTGGVTLYRIHWPVLIQEGQQDPEFAHKLAELLEEKTNRAMTITTTSPMCIRLASVYRNKEGEPTPKFDIPAVLKLQSADDLQPLEEEVVDLSQTNLTTYARIKTTPRKTIYKNGPTTSDSWANLEDENGSPLSHLSTQAVVDYKNESEDGSANKSLTVTMQTVPDGFLESLGDLKLEASPKMKIKIPKDNNPACFADGQRIEFSAAYDALSRGTLCVFHVKPSFYGSYMSKKCLSFTLLGMNIQFDTVAEPPAKRRKGK